MQENDVQKKAADTVNERPILIWFGLIPFVVSPLTFGQIEDIGAIAVDMPEIDIEKIDGMNAVAAALSFSGESGKMKDIAVVVMFRSMKMRKLFGSFIKKRLTVSRFKKLQNYMAEKMDATFFLTTIIFLKGINQMTKTTNTPEATALGVSSAE